MATPDQIRRRGRWSLVIGTVLAALLFATIAFADNLQSDLNTTTGGLQKTVDLGTLPPNTAKSQDVFLFVDEQPSGGNNPTYPFNVAGVKSLASTFPGAVAFSGVTISGPNTASGQTGQVTWTTPAAQATAQSYSIVETFDANTTINESPATITIDFSIAAAPADSTPPVITPNVSGTVGNNGWYTSDVAVTWTVTDPDSAISSSSGCGPTTITSDTSGTTLTCTATSAGGTASQSVTIKRDATAPTISGSASPAPNGNAWNNTDVTVSFTCDDPTSGITSCAAPQTLSSEGAGQSASGTATDNAGNTASTTVSGINIDKTAPTASASAAPPANGNGWNNSDVTVTFTGSDALSDIDFCDPAVVLSVEGAGQSASGRCTDNAGNVSDPATASGINIDKTAPTVALAGGPTGGGSYYFGSVPAAPTCSAADALSGLDGTCVVSGYHTTVGTHTVKATATDLAGNTATDQRSYTVLAWTLNGFFQPVDMGATVWNAVKGGSTVPLKFEIFAGATELTDTANVDSFSAKPVTCPNGDVTVDDIEVTVTGGTSLRYDATGGQFIYNWQTPKKPGSCYELTMKTDDGSTLKANFKLK